MLRLNRRKLRETTRPSGHVIRQSFTQVHTGGAIPSNVIRGDWDDLPESLLEMGNNAANDAYTLRCKEEGIKIHPARFPALLPKFFVKMLTEPDDLVVDPFGGSLTTGAVAEALERRWIAGEAGEDYLRARGFPFSGTDASPKRF